jgi:methionyl-tRNA formyltransferase
LKAALLLSGNLGFKCLQQFPVECNIICIFTDKRSTAIINWAKEKNIPLFAGNPRNGAATAFIKDHQPDILFSINYLFLIEADLIKWPAKYCFNIHGSLLPKYRGRTPHVWAIINGEKETGATIHLVDDGCDTGDIILQKKISINDHMTGADVLSAFYELYPKMISEVIRQVMNATIHPTPQDHSKATYFGIRTPDSGRIDWNWEKQRIYNWVRAQAIPYPQAFTFCEEQKITINRIIFADSGFNAEDANGLVLDVTNGKPIVKTPNGAILLEEFETQNGLEIKAGKILI